MIRERGWVQASAPPPTDKKVFPKDNIRYRFKKALKRAKIYNFVWHDLRHTFGTQLVLFTGVGFEFMVKLVGKTPNLGSESSFVLFKELASNLWSNSKSSKIKE